ncbi:solute carrier family 35, member C2 [Cryptococcus neoformans C23]|uniref:Solute carrier family 35, member C2 n=2 Tax=Cryptococcus neoformans TaxID=5207 RepID=A0A854QKI9_CRYNE|nr:solute carrier family 35, member C2 [Cryptococcus neoformans var. grubii H99]AUB22975.1 solute carrier family 35, member C2 [Cryptococcus neoformans var. grubii]OWZ46923.1 solute carrier family 35, member C2 [Cryptococcus neoformans var. grubii C23]OWZ50713.1 solute carrier family 35, member C2 [Cryptococcus neoformans var. grubii AD1-83a]OWZ56517.1 solute carrier family 35, member C2 [Cryptococcus neoformans var. grubii 125.91]OXC86416.1 solute carrier family 35, member C2 [Cryptococcus ne|eukprot:XP_012047556.1 solute carrier family 35, member C2 [Cryptococcus neoformans var. grubii H99]
MDRDTESISGPSRPAVYDPVSVQDTSFDAPPGYSQNGHTYSADPNGYQKGKSSFPRDPTFERNGTSIDGVNHQHEGHRHATLAMKKALWWRNAIVTGTFILTWYAFATLLSLYNKWMFSPQYYNFQYPLFVTACHMIVQFALAALIRIIWADKFRPKERPMRGDYLTKILPTAASTGGDIGLSNLSLKTITLSLYTMCKSSTLIFVLIFAFAFRLETYSLRLISVISLISFGVFCMVFNTTTVSIPGILMVFSASALGGLRWALTELVMHKKAMGLSNPFATIFWLAPLMAVTLAIASMIVEGWFGILRSEFFEGWRAIETGGVIVLPGTLAFAMVASEYFVIQRAGVVPLSIAGIFKEVSTISISAWVFGDQLTTFNIIGVVITITGIALYSFHKYQKSISSTVELDAEGKPITTDDSAEPLIAPSHTRHSSVGNRQSYEHDPLASITNNVPLSYLSSSANPSSHDVSLTSTGAREREEEEVNKAKDDFEGWDRPGEWSVDEEELEEVAEEEVERRMREREGQMDKQGKWGEWLNKRM